MHYAAEIDRGRVTLSTALSYLALLIIFNGILENAVGLEELTAINIFPVVDEALRFALVLAVMALFAGVMFVLMKVVGGRRTYKKTLITQILLAVIIYPMAMLIDAGAFLLDPAAYGAMTEREPYRL